MCVCLLFLFEVLCVDCDNSCLLSFMFSALLGCSQLCPNNPLQFLNLEKNALGEASTALIMSSLLLFVSMIEVRLTRERNVDIEVEDLIRQFEDSSFLRDGDRDRELMKVTDEGEAAEQGQGQEVHVSLSQLSIAPRHLSAPSKRLRHHRSFVALSLACKLAFLSVFNCNDVHTRVHKRHTENSLSSMIDNDSHSPLGVTSLSADVSPRSLPRLPAELVVVIFSFCEISVFRRVCLL